MQATLRRVLLLSPNKSIKNSLEQVSLLTGIKMKHEIHAKLPEIKKLNLPQLQNQLAGLPTSGRLMRSSNNLVYLDIDDAYVHEIFALMTNPDAKKPNYFGCGSAGAHITVVYPEENTMINNAHLHQEHSFVVKEAVVTTIGKKDYYVLMVDAPSLVSLRLLHGLPKDLDFKGYSIGLHITFATSL